MAAKRKKGVSLDQELLERAREAAGARAETEAISLALEEAMRRRRFIEGIEALARLGPIDASKID